MNLISREEGLHLVEELDGKFPKAEAIEEFHLKPIDWGFQGGRNWKGKD